MSRRANVALPSPGRIRALETSALPGPGGIQANLEHFFPDDPGSRHHRPGASGRNAEDLASAWAQGRGGYRGRLGGGASLRGVDVSDADARLLRETLEGRRRTHNRRQPLSGGLHHGASLPKSRQASKIGFRLRHLSSVFFRCSVGHGHSPWNRLSCEPRAQGGRRDSPVRLPPENGIPRPSPSRQRPPWNPVSCEGRPPGRQRSGR